MQLAEKKVNFIYLHDDMLWQAQVYAMSLCLCLSVHLSHVGVLLKTAKRRITQTELHDSPGISTGRASHGSVGIS